MRDTSGAGWTSGFVALMFGRALFTLGSAAAPVALTFGVIESGGGSVELGVVVCAFFGPQLAFSLLSGVLADRLRKRLLLVAANTVGGASQAVVAYQLLSGAATFRSLLVLSLLSGTMSAMAAPATQSAIRGLVAVQRLQQAHARLRMVQGCARVAGPAVAGIVTGAYGAGAAVLVDSCTRLAAAVALGLATRCLPIADTAAGTWMTSLRAGWTYYWRTRWLVAVGFNFMLVNAVWVCAIGVLGPLRVTESFGGPQEWGWLMAAFFLGGLVGAGTLVRRAAVRHALLIGCCASALKVLAPMSLASDSLGLALLAFTLAGLGTESFGVLYAAEVQRRVPERLLGRVMSVDIFLGTALLPLGYLTAAFWAGLLGERLAFQASAAVILAATAGMLGVLASGGELRRRAAAG